RLFSKKFYWGGGCSQNGRGGTYRKCRVGVSLVGFAKWSLCAVPQGEVTLQISRAGMNVYRPVESVKVKAPKRKMFLMCWSGLMFTGTLTVSVVADITVGE